MLPVLQTPILDPWAIMWPLLKAVAFAALILIPLALVKGLIEGRTQRRRRRISRD